MVPSAGQRERWLYRYPLAVRAAHWTNVLCLAILLMSGLQIFNAHPALYWGEDSDFEQPLLSIAASWNNEGRPMGITRIVGRSFETTGVLGWSRLNGRPVPRAFPAWVTIPSAQDLATGRVWHFFFAWVFVVNGALYVGYSILSRRLSRDLLPRREELSRIGQVLRDHLTRRVFQGAASYNVVQKLTYVAVVLVLAPAALLTGLTMSPAVGAVMSWLPDLFGGRQSARTVHFVVGGLLVLFLFMHVTMVVASGFLANMRSMITGWRRADRTADLT